MVPEGPATSCWVTTATTAKTLATGGSSIAKQIRGRPWFVYYSFDPERATTGLGVAARASVGTGSADGSNRPVDGRWRSAGGPRCARIGVPSGIRPTDCSDRGRRILCGMCWSLALHLIRAVPLLRVDRRVRPAASHTATGFLGPDAPSPTPMSFQARGSFGEGLPRSVSQRDLGSIRSSIVPRRPDSPSAIRKGEGEALDKLVRSNLRFVVSVAKKYQNQGVPLSDLINEGNLGLIRAAHKFDETKGIPKTPKPL